MAEVFSPSVGFGPGAEPGFGSRFAGGFFRGGQGPPKIFGFLKCIFFHHKRYVAAVAAVAIGFKVYNVVKTRNLRKKWAEAGKDVVVLHTLRRGHVHPCASPFSVKLETFFRMADIKYVLDYKMPFGPKKKIPWITLKGEDYSDSELIIQDLQQKLKKFPDEGVPEPDRAVAVAMQVMLEEYALWGLAYWRFIEDRLQTVFSLNDFPSFQKSIMRLIAGKYLRKALYSQGLGRHSDVDKYRLLKRCFKALSVHLGDKQFICGDKPTVADCSIFAFVSQLLDNCPGSPFSKWIQEEFPNLQAYSDRMKAKFWPDWKQVITKPDLVL